MGEEFNVGLTARQRQAYEFIKAGIRHGLCPSYEEIAAHMNLKGKSNVSRLVDALVRKKYLQRSASKNARSLALIDQDRNDAMEALGDKLEQAEMVISMLGSRTKTLLSKDSVKKDLEIFEELVAIHFYLVQIHQDIAI